MHASRIIRTLLLGGIASIIVVLGITVLHANAATDSGTPGGDSLPDLTIQSVIVELETPASCSTPPKVLGTRVRIANNGSAAAGPFTVTVNGAQQEVPGLTAGATTTRWFPGYTNGMETVVVVDATSAVAESNEDNNTYSSFVPLPTPLPTCTPPPGLAGDASCDGTVNSIDAALILQRDAGLILGSVPCQALADVNQDGDSDALDAALVLQYAAGLLSSLPA